MNSEVEKTPGIPLPQPATELGRPGFEPAQAAQVNPEFLPMGAEQAAVSSGMSVAQAHQQHFDNGSSASQKQSSIQQTDDNSATAGDDEEIDELWITKAKEIVDKTRSDPFRQSREISKIKAEFLKSRYNKEIKVIED